MNAGRKPGRRAARRLLAGTVLAAGVAAATSAPASAATTATFNAGVLSVTGDNGANAIVVSRNAAGRILVNGGAIAVAGGTPTVANTQQIQVFGLVGNDTLTFNEANGALPRANLFGGSDNDVLTGGSGTDQLFGQAGNDTLLGRGGTDLLFGGEDNDTITGGDADDQAFGQSGDDRMVWNQADDTDLNEGGVGTDTVEVNGANGAEQFTTTANGTRVRFDRVAPAPFAIDIGTSENLVVAAKGGDDSFSATGNLAALIKLTVDGGAGDDTLQGGNGADILLGGDGDDVADGNQGDDVGFLGAGDDTFRWDPGDADDVVEGQDGADTLAFNGSNTNEIMDASANGGRVRFTRNVANITMDLNDVESITARTVGGTDDVTVHDLSGTDVTRVTADLSATLGGDDGAADRVVAEATNGEDVASITGAGPNATVRGLATRVAVAGAGAGDRLTVRALAGDDVIDASVMPAGTVTLTLDGGAGDDVLIGGAGDDVLLGGAGDDVLIGGPGADTIDGAPGDDVVVQSLTAGRVRSAAVVGQGWLTAHARTGKAGRTMLVVDGEKRKLPRADRARLARGLRAS